MRRIFIASCAALTVTAMSFALRGSVGDVWAAQFHLTHEQVGWINGAAFWGFASAVLFGGLLLDRVGMNRILALAFLAHLGGIAFTVLAWNYRSLWIGTFCFGIGHGSVSAACAPLIATLYSQNKTTKLNQMHVWFPGGVALGGLVAFAMNTLGVGWRVQFAFPLLPLLLYGFLFLGQRLPQTERVQQGITNLDMFKACARPGFILMVACMLMTAATELGTNQWIPVILSHAHVSGILVLVWISTVMALGRQSAGVFVHRLSPLGMLMSSAVLSGLGLFAISQASGSWLFGAATLFAFGVCFFWPTMLGFVSENHPRTGAVGLAIVNCAGVVGVAMVLPFIGHLFDAGIAARLSAASGMEVTATQWSTIQAAAGLEALGRMVFLPAILSITFLALLLLHRRKRSGSLPAAR